MIVPILISTLVKSSFEIGFSIVRGSRVSLGADLSLILGFASFVSVGIYSIFGKSAGIGFRETWLKILSFKIKSE